MQPLNSIYRVALCLGVACGANFAFAKGPGGTNGGNGSTSRPELVQSAIDDLRQNLHDLTNRMRAYIRSPYSSDRAAVTSGNVINFFENKKLDSTLRGMTIEPKQGNCPSLDPNHLDGSADRARQLICISVTRMTRYSASSVKFEVLALGVHELAHLLGYHEWEAQLIQDWVLDHNRITDMNPEPMKEILSKYTDATSAINEMLNILSLNITPSETFMNFCKNSTELYERMDRQPRGIFVPESTLVNSKDLEELLVRPLEWKQNTCRDFKPFNPEEKSRVIAQANNLKRILKDQAYKILDYDSTNRRLAWWLKYL